MLAKGKEGCCPSQATESDRKLTIKATAKSRWQEKIVHPHTISVELPCIG